MAAERPTQHLDRTSLQRRRTLEGYFAASAPPRWMERVAQVDTGIAAVERELSCARAVARAAHPADDEAFARAWRQRVAAWRFDPGLNELIGQHNDWYPIERRLPVNPRTGELVPVHGRSHRRPVLDAAWALQRFPAG